METQFNHSSQWLEENRECTPWFTVRGPLHSTKLGTASQLSKRGPGAPWDSQGPPGTVSPHTVS